MKILACVGLLGFPAFLTAQLSMHGPTCGKQFVSEPGAGYTWSEVTNAKCDDDESRAHSAPLTRGQYTQVLKISNFGFSIPADARIEGIEVVLIRKADVADAIVDKAVQLMRDNVQVGADLRLSSRWDETWTAVYYGDGVEDWDHAWSVHEINSAGFGVAISAMNLGAIATPQVDEVLVTVHFTYGASSGRTHKASSSASRYSCNGWGG